MVDFHWKNEANRWGSEISLIRSYTDSLLRVLVDIIFRSLLGYDPKASDPIEDTSSQVNLAILFSLERLNEGMAQLTDYMYHGWEAEENEHGESLGTGKSASVVNIQQDRIVKPNGGTEDSREGDDSVLSNYSSLLELDLETKAPKVNNEIADVVNKLWLHRVSTDQC